MKYLLLLNFVLVPSFIWANTLLIISSSDGMYSSDYRMNLSIESFGANLVEYKLKEDYRKVYKYTDTKNKQNLEELLEEIVKDRIDGEKLDIFSMQHGPDGLPFNGLRINELKNIIPYNFLRYVYSTSCSEFGEFKAKNNNDVQITKYNSEFSKNLQILGIEKYIYFANDNSTGLFTIPLMLRNIHDFKDWGKAAEETSLQYDESSSVLIPALAALRGNKTAKKILPSFFNSSLDWESLFNSRMIIAQKKGSTKITPMIRIDSNEFEEIMPAMTKNLETVISSMCPKGISPYMDCVSKSDLSLHEPLKIVFSQISDLFKLYSPDNSCLPGEILQPFLDEYDFSNFKFKKFCLIKKNDERFEIQWKLSTRSLFKTRLALLMSNDPILNKITISK